jgi:hypothetical protein
VPVAVSLKQTETVEQCEAEGVKRWLRVRESLLVAVRLAASVLLTEGLLETPGVLLPVPEAQGWAETVKLTLRLARSVAVAHRLGLCDPRGDGLAPRVIVKQAVSELLWLRESVSEAEAQAVAVSEGGLVTEREPLGEVVGDE